MSVGIRLFRRLFCGLGDADERENERMVQARGEWEMGMARSQSLFFGKTYGGRPELSAVRDAYERDEVSRRRDIDERFFRCVSGPLSTSRW